MKRLLLSLFLLCTLMVQAQDGKIKFAVLADTHLGAYASASADLRAALEDINARVI